MYDYEVECQGGMSPKCTGVTKIKLPYGLTRNQVNELHNGGETAFTKEQIIDSRNKKWFNLSKEQEEELLINGFVYYYLDFEGGICANCKSNISFHSLNSNSNLH